MAVATYTRAGAKATTAASLDKKVFGVEVMNHDLLKQAYTTYLANGRLNSARTKKRGEVRGGGAKPWRQKGTGRARFGSSRNPVWTGGGVAFGPTGEENYSKKLNTAAKKAAIRQALSLANKGGKIIIIEDFAPAGAKTKAAGSLLAKIKVSGNILVVVDNKTPEIDRATRNLEGVKISQAAYVNVYDVLNADYVIVAKPALQPLSDWLGGK